MSEEVHEDVTSYNGRPSRKKGCVVYRLSFFFFSKVPKYLSELLCNGNNVHGIIIVKIA